MTSLFSRSKPVIGVIHVGALPGTPRSERSVAELVRGAREEAKVYRECGVDGIIIENMHDVPYLKGKVGPEIVAAMTVIGTEEETLSACDHRGCEPGTNCGDGRVHGGGLRDRDGQRHWRSTENCGRAGSEAALSLTSVSRFRY